jgi:hypothetical protein
MQSEEMDNRIREAAENHHPAYNEKAWPEMEKLLDKHLPLQKDKRRRFLLWWLLPLLMGGAYLLFTQIQNSKKNTTADADTKAGGIVTTNNQSNNNKKNPVAQPANGNTTSTTANEQPPAPAGDNLSGPGSVITIPGENAPTADKSIQQGVAKKQTAIADKVTNTDNRVQPDALFTTGKGGIAKKKNKGATAGRDNNTTKPIANNTNTLNKPVATAVLPGAIANKTAEPKQPDENPAANKQNDVADKPGTAVTPAGLAALQPEKKAVKTDSVAEQKTTAEPVAKKNAPAKKKSSLFLSFSAGPDMSFVSSEKAGSVKLLTGLGLGYNYKDRLTLRTGFYTARKIYTAGGDAYNPPAGFSQFYPYLEKVDANCKVYEIPVALSYNFARKGSRNFFVSGGLSTLLMKEETYNYYYKYTPNGRTYTNKWTVKNENKHFFSVLTLSGGYQRSIGKRVSLTAEPYLKLPLGGVGYGRVKLNSGGVLFSVGVKLF